MVIAFSCPHCGEAYRLKDELAGKRATCKQASCRRPFIVPAATPVRPNGPVDAEALAAATLLEEQPAPAAKSKGTIEAHCQFCDHRWGVDAALEGKNVPCPECRRIVKVPVRKVEKPADWRTGKGGPSLAKQEKLEGAWDDASTYAKHDSLRQAGAVEEQELEPVSKLRRARQVMLLLAAVGAVAFGVLAFVKNRKEVKQERFLADAVKEVEADKDLPTPALFQAAIYKAAGEQRVRAIGGREDLEEADRLLTVAAARLRDAPQGAAERDGLLIEVALQMADLGGTPDEVTQEKRREWQGRKSVQERIRQTLQNLSADRDLKVMALRKVARKLSAKQQGELALPIAHEIIPDDLAEAFGQVGLELFEANQKEAAKKVLEKTVTALGDTPEKAAQAPSLTALRLALGGEQPVPAGKIPVLPAPGAAGQVPDAVRIAYAEGLAAQGKFEQARTLAERPGNAEGRVRALVAVAHAALEAGKGGDASAAAERAAGILTKEMKGSTPPKWLVVRTAAAAARAGKTELATAAADSISDASVKAWAKYEVFRGRLAAQPKQAGSESWLEDLGGPAKPRVVQALAREDLARHNAALGDAAFDKTVDSWKGGMHAFGVAGLLLGRQDRTMR